MITGDYVQYLNKYIVENFTLLTDSENLQLDASTILAVEYMNDYEMSRRPVLKVVLRVDIRRKLWILKRKTKLKCKFVLNKIAMELDYESFISAVQPFWNMTFQCYFNEDDNSLDVNQLEERLINNEQDERQRMEEIETESYNETQNIQEIYLINQKMLDGENKIINDIYTSTLLENAVARICTEAKFKRVLMSRVENKEKYKELLIPAAPSYKCLEYIDQYYGLYKVGSMIYFDLDTLYILNLCNKVTAKRKNEWSKCRIMVSKADMATPGNGMATKDGEECYFISVSEGNVSAMQYTIGNNETVGSAAMVITSDGTTVNLNNADQSFINDRNYSLIHHRRDDNKYTGTTTTARMEENECMLYLNADNLAIDAFTPNKRYKFVFDDEKKNKMYGKMIFRMAYAYHYFKLETDQFMSSSHHIAFKKCCGKDENW